MRDQRPDLRATDGTQMKRGLLPYSICGSLRPLCSSCAWWFLAPKVSYEVPMRSYALSTHFLCTFYAIPMRFLYRIRTTFAAKQAVFRQNMEVSRLKKNFAGCLSPATCHGELKRSTGERVENKRSNTERTTNDTNDTNTHANGRRFRKGRQLRYLSVPPFFCRFVLPTVPLCSLCSFVALNLAELAAKRRKVRKRRAVPKRFPSDSRMFPNAPIRSQTILKCSQMVSNPFFNQFSVKHTPFCRRIAKSLVLFFREATMTGITRMPSRLKAFSGKAPTTAFFCPLFFCRIVRPAVSIRVIRGFRCRTSPPIATRRRKHMTLRRNPDRVLIAF
jgi:hypothetical protein